MTLKRKPLLLVIATDCMTGGGASIRFTESFDLSTVVADRRECEVRYDLVGVMVSDGGKQNKEKLQYFFKPEAEEGAQISVWLKSSAGNLANLI